MAERIYIPKDKNLLDPKVDSTFKTLFIQEGQSSKIALKSIIKAAIGYEPETVEVINNELPKDIENAKNIRLDLQCRMSDGERIGIEMQTCRDGDDLTARSFYYGCKMVSSLGLGGRTYMEIPKVYQIIFTNFNLFGEKSRYLYDFSMRSEELQLTDKLQIIFIKMPLVKERDRDVETLSDIEKWVIFLRDSTDKNQRDLLNRIMDTNEGIREAGEILMAISEDEREWVRQETRLKAEYDYQSSILTAHKKGHKEGLETAARGMKVKKIPTEIIMEVTGLTAEQVAAL